LLRKPTDVCIYRDPGVSRFFPYRTSRCGVKRVRHGAHSDGDMIGPKTEFPEYGASAFRAEMKVQLPPVLRITNKDVVRARGLHLCP
jgi:hypothetical protein